MTDDSSTFSYRIEPLKGDNYVTWRIQMTDILSELDLWDYVAGTQTTMPTEATLQADWKKKDAKALRAIRLRLAQDVLVYAQDAVTAKEAWDTLAETFQPTGPIGIVSVRRKLFRAQCPDAGDIEEHLRQLRTYRSELHALGQQLSDSDFAMTILTSLPDSWDAFIRAIDPTDLVPAKAGESPRLTSAKLIARILQEDRRLKARTADSETALAARSRPAPRDKSRITCFRCGQRGHYENECRNAPLSSDEQARLRQKILASRSAQRSNRSHANIADSTPTTPPEPDSTTPSLGTAWIAEDSNDPDLDPDPDHEPDHDPDRALAADADVWYLDSGATVHICRDRADFREYSETPGKTITGVGGHTVPQLGRGTVVLVSRLGSATTKLITLQHVAHMPAATHNLISVSRITDTGAKITFNRDVVEIRSADGELLMTGTKSGRLWRMAASADTDRAFSATQPRTWDQWHRVYGHLNHDYLRRLARRGLVTGMAVDESVPPTSQCPTCIQAKQSVKPFPQKSDSVYSDIGDLTVVDMWGPARVKGIRGETYLTVFTDVATRYRVRFFSSDKKQQLHFIQAYRAFLKTQASKPMKAVRFDNGKEMINESVKHFLRSHGILYELTAPYSSAQNGIAERSFLTILNAARALLFEHDLPTFLWPEAVSYVIYLINRSPTRALPDKTPFEAFWGRKPDVSHLQEFGTDCWVLRQDTQLHKLARKSKPCKFVGFSEESRAYRYYNPATRQVLTSRNVIMSDSDTSVEGEPVITSPPAAEGEQSSPEQPPADAPSPPEPPKSESAPAPAVAKPPPSQIPVRTSARQAQRFAAEGRPDFRAINLGNAPAYRPINNPSAARAPPGWERVVPDSSSVAVDDPDGADIIDYVLAANSVDDPQSLAEAQSRPDWPDWKAAMDREIAQLERLGTFELVTCPPGRKPIGCKWVFRLKRDILGEILKYKARLVAQGFAQIFGLDFTETFAPVVRLETLRILIALGVILGLDIQVADFVGAYLNGHLQEEIYMRQPPMYDNGRGQVWRLRRTLYGLKQSGREWNTELDEKFNKLGFKRLVSDQCVYLRTQPPKFWIVGVHVDDMMSLSRCTADTDALYVELGQYFELTKLGPLRQMVGLEAERDTRAQTLTIRQSQFIDRILARFGMTDANPVDTPLDPNVRLCANDGPEDPVLRSLYQAIVGSLMYAAIGTRVDIAHAVQQLSQYSSNPSPVHLTAAKRVLRYLKGTRSLGITYHAHADRELPLEPIGYSDADWGNDLDDRKSISGQVFLLAGAPITWSSRKQRTVAKSSMEAEYMAASAAASEVAWLRTLLTELGFPPTQPTPLYVDNNSAIASAHAKTSHARTKHIDIHYHFIRERITSNEVKVTHCASEDNFADILTKALPRPRHQSLIARMGMRA